MPVPCSGALTGVVATGELEPVAEGTASVCGAPALPTEPQVKFRFIYIAHLKKNKQTEKSKTTCRPKYLTGSRKQCA